MDCEGLLQTLPLCIRKLDEINLRVNSKHSGARTPDARVLHFVYEIEGQAGGDKEWPHRANNLRFIYERQVNANKWNAYGGAPLAQTEEGHRQCVCGMW